MVLLSKFLALPLYPLGMVFILQLTGIFLLWMKKRTIATGVFISGFLLLFTFSLSPVAHYLARALEKKFIQEYPPNGSCSAIVILGGGGSPHTLSKKYVEINDAGDRLLHGARMFRMGIAPRIITTGKDAGTALFDPICEGEQNAMVLRDMGIDSSVILVEKQARNTHEHAPNIARMLDSLHLDKTILLVTSASHMYRSVLVFRKYGFKVYTAPTDFQTSERTISRSTEFFPSIWALELSTVALHEYYGILAYKILRWI